MTGAIAYLATLFPKPTTPDEVYEWTPFLWVAVVALVVEIILLARQSEADRRRKRKVWDEVGGRTRLVWTRRRMLGYALGFAGGLIGWTTGQAADFHGAASRLAFAEVVMTLGLAAFFCAPFTLWAPRFTSRALFTLGGLLVIAAAVAPLLRPLGSDWKGQGFAPTYFLLGTAACVLAAGVVALIEARHPGEAPDLYAAEEGGA
jgi:hypothetical protein